MFDDVILYVRTERQLLAYYTTVLDVFKLHYATVKLKRRK